jgi:two-component system response regulator RegA
VTDRDAVSELATSLLLVDDDDVFRTRLARALRDRGFDVHDFGDPALALAHAERDPPELAVVDLRMPDASGLDMVQALKRLEPATRIVVLTGYGSIATALEAVRLGATHYLTKPATVNDIVKSFDGLAAPAARREPDGVPSLARVEWEHINRVLTECQGNVTRAAQMLHMHRRSLQRKLAKYPVNE